MSPESFLTVTPVNVAPLSCDANLPFWEQEWIAKPLFEMLFGTQGQNTYLVVDANLRTNITGIFDLDVLDLPTRCLFKGEAEEQMGESAPYLVDLTLSDGEPTHFHKTFFADHWDKGTGLLICSDVNMDTLWRHLRKFTRCHRDNEPDRFFRFWETNTARDYFSGIALMPSRCKDWFQVKGGGWISLILSHAERIGQTHKVLPDVTRLAGVDYSAGPFSLTQLEEAALLKGVLRGHAKLIERSIASEFPDRVSSDLENYVLNFVLDAHTQGVRDVEQIKAALFA